MKTPHKCPICDGTSSVPNGFYLRVGTPNWTTGSLNPELCRTCNGTGIVWSSEDCEEYDFKLKGGDE